MSNLYLEKIAIKVKVSPISAGAAGVALAYGIHNNRQHKKTQKAIEDLKADNGSKPLSGKSTK